jgi:hypothetical protein
MVAYDSATAAISMDRCFQTEGCVTGVENTASPFHCTTNSHKAPILHYRNNNHQLFRSFMQHKTTAVCFDGLYFGEVSEKSSPRTFGRSPLVLVKSVEPVGGVNV